MAHHSTWRARRFVPAPQIRYKKSRLAVPPHERPGDAHPEAPSARDGSTPAEPGERQPLQGFDYSFDAVG